MASPISGELQAALDALEGACDALDALIAAEAPDSDVRHVAGGLLRRALEAWPRLLQAEIRDAARAEERSQNDD